MSLSRLVEFRNKVQVLLEDTKDNSQFLLYLSKISKLKNEFNDLSPSELDTAISSYDSLLEKHQTVIGDLNDYIVKLNSDIDLISAQVCDTAKLHEEYITQELDLTQHLPTVKIKISKYSDWRYPCLHVMPRHKELIDSSVSGDPFYLIGPDISAINNLISSYPVLYQRRLRLYELKDRNLKILPQSQFGFVLCWDFFNYLGPDVVEGYLRQIFDLLRPGGVLMFSYANCDNETIARRAETSANGYFSVRAVQQLANTIGYEIIDLIDLPTNDPNVPYISWAELKKPGELATIKRHQSIAEIIEK